MLPSQMMSAGATQIEDISPTPSMPYFILYGATSTDYKPLDFALDALDIRHIFLVPVIRATDETNSHIHCIYSESTSAPPG